MADVVLKKHCKLLSFLQLFKIMALEVECHRSWIHVSIQGSTMRSGTKRLREVGHVEPSHSLKLGRPI